MIKKFPLLICLSVVAFSSCGDTEIKAQTVPKAVVSDKITKEVGQASEKRDLSQLSISELQANVVELNKQIQLLDGDGDIRKRIALRKQVLVLEKAKTAREKAKTAREKAKTEQLREALKQSCKLAGEDC